MTFIMLASEMRTFLNSFVSHACCSCLSISHSLFNSSSDPSFQESRSRLTLMDQFKRFPCGLSDSNKRIFLDKFQQIVSPYYDFDSVVLSSSCTAEEELSKKSTEREIEFRKNNKNDN